MRTYYIFNINKEMSILTKDSPYMLFKSFESIYKKGKLDYNIARDLYETLACKFDQNLINRNIINIYNHNDFYQYRNNHHFYYNKYRDETCDLKIKNSYIICNTNGSRLELLKKISGYNLFACDFENKDYFWLDQINA